MPIPDHLIGSRALAIHPHPTVYNHQAVVLDLLNEGRKAVVSTLVASGKTLIFMVLALHVTQAEPEATAMVFYPAKALAGDQPTCRQQTAGAANMDSVWVQQITGDTPMRHHEQFLQKAAVPLVPPAWSTHGSSEQPVDRPRGGS